jgi:hypothetical protein
MDMKDKAMDVLRSSYFFPHFLEAVERAGLVGEKRNALVVFIVGVSRLLQKPLNLFVKGPSSGGKNFLVKTILRFFLSQAFIEITSSSGASWNYLGKDLKHRIVYLQEENKAAGSVHPARLLISENRLVRMVTRRKGHRFVTERHVTEGPVACISTTTSHRLEIDDETRHLSIVVDDSPEQTRDIMFGLTEDTDRIAVGELAMWHEIQNIIATRAGLPIEIPHWFRKVAEMMEAGDVRARRYFAAFLEACKVVCLIRSFKKGDLNPSFLEIGFIDYAMTTLIFGNAFSSFLGGVGLQEFETRRAVELITKRRNNADVVFREIKHTRV